MNKSDWWSKKYLGETIYIIPSQNNKVLNTILHFKYYLRVYKLKNYNVRLRNICCKG